jgi:hypothetical protein
MNERTPSDPEMGGSTESSQQPPTAARVIASRRQFAKAGAAVPVVLGSLLSKPALAAQPYNCTVSGQISGNTSPHPGQAVCKTLGSPPATWKATTAWPSGTLAGWLPNSGCSFSMAAPKGTAFGGFMAGGNTLLDAFRYGPGGGTCNVYGIGDAAFASATINASMLQVLNTTSTALLFELGRATVATILNALSKGADFPVSPAQAIKMFNDAVSAGGYKVNTTVTWDAARVLAYFRSLYQ